MQNTGTPAIHGAEDVSMFIGSALLISLPGKEIVGIGLSGSVVEPEEVLASAVSLELRSAIEIVRSEALKKNIQVKCIARPELFTHGVSERWLRTQIACNSQHLCLSDGTTLHHLPGVPTHVFFYHLSLQDNMLALHRLSRRAPELMLQVQSQVNSHFVLGDGVHRVRPVSLFLSRATRLEHPQSTLLPFFLNRNSAEDSANRIEQEGPIDFEGLTAFKEMLYVPLTETAMAEGTFARTVAALIVQAYFDLAILLVLRLPPNRDGENALARRIAAILPALRDSGIVIPRAPSSNIIFATHDLEEDHQLLRRVSPHVLVHESFDFWHHTFSFYAQAARVTVLAKLDPTSGPDFLPYDVSAIYGPKAVRRWVEAKIID
jgi:hypothetical protein